MLHPGLYEQVINNQRTSELLGISEGRKSTVPIDKAEASKVQTQYLSEVMERGLNNVRDNRGDLSDQIEVTNQIVILIQNAIKEADLASVGVAQSAGQLLVLLWESDPRPAAGNSTKDVERPEASITQNGCNGWKDYGRTKLCNTLSKVSHDIRWTRLYAKTYVF